METKIGSYELIEGGCFIRLRLRNPEMRAALERPDHTPEGTVTEQNPLGEVLTISGDGVGDLAGPLTLGFIDKDGTVEEYKGPLKVRVSGHGPRATMRYWEESQRSWIEGMGEIHFSIYLESEKMAWLWARLVERPRSDVVIGFNAPLYQMGIEAAFGEVGDREHLYMPKAFESGEKHFLELTEVTLAVVSGGPEPATESSERINNQEIKAELPKKPTPWYLQPLWLGAILILLGAYLMMPRK